MKIYARQVPPEQQESPLDFDPVFWPGNVITDGNWRLVSHTTDEYDRIKESFADMAHDWQEDQEQTMADCVHYYLPPEHKEVYADQDLAAWKNLIDNYKGRLDDETICAALHLMTGIEYASMRITGCVQGDWQDLYYPADYGPDFVKEFQAWYFNTGTEYRIYDDIDDPDEMDNATPVYHYTTHYNTDDIKREIAAEAGVDPADVVLYQFDHYDRIPRYTVA